MPSPVDRGRSESKGRGLRVEYLPERLSRDGWIECRQQVVPLPAGREIRKMITEVQVVEHPSVPRHVDQFGILERKANRSSPGSFGAVHIAEDLGALANLQIKPAGVVDHEVAHMREHVLD
jgi:hypothetical protein